MIFGAVTLACLLVAMALSVHGQHPLLMIPTAVACAFVFIRHGDGRQHSVLPASASEEKPRRDRSRA